MDRMDKDPTVEQYKSELLNRIDCLRNHALDSNETNNELNDATADFNLQLQKDLNAEYGDSTLGSKIPEWHKLVGSTLEMHNIEEDAKRFILDEITNFVEGFENKWDI
ncbi:MAG: hypothetical protein ACI9SY_000444 [Candidatus Paceibacteria bacterium]|jgi:hypothetical protein